MVTLVTAAQSQVEAQVADALLAQSSALWASMWSRRSVAFACSMSFVRHPLEQDIHPATAEPIFHLLWAYNALHQARRAAPLMFIQHYH